MPPGIDPLKTELRACLMSFTRNNYTDAIKHIKDDNKYVHGN